MKKLVMTVVLSLMTAAALSSCVSAVQVHDKNYLRAVSVDGENEKQLTFTFFTEKSSIITASGEDITSAQKLAELKSGKDIFTGYTELIILGDSSGSETLEFMLNEWKVSPSCLIVYGENGKEILEEESAETLVNSVKRAMEQGKAPECDIITVLGELLDEDGTADVPIITSDGAAGCRTIK